MRTPAPEFAMSSEPAVGDLLAVLAAAVRPGGRILEIGTGAGAGLARLIEGLGARTDVEVHTVEVDPALTLSGDRPSFVHQHLGDVLGLFATLGTFDLIFADAPGGKWHGLDRTIAALTPGGLLLVDDMTPAEWGSDEHKFQTLRVRDTLLNHVGLRAAEIGWSSGLILCARRTGAAGAC